MLSSRRNSTTTNDYNQVYLIIINEKLLTINFLQDEELENGLQTYTLDRSFNTEYRNHRSNLKNAAPGKRILQNFLCIYR